MPNTEMITKVRDTADAKRRQISTFLHTEGHAASAAHLEGCTKQLIELNAIVAALDFALGGNEVNWGTMMSAITNMQVGDYSPAY